MLIHAHTFSKATQWSRGEGGAMNQFQPLLVPTLPPNVVSIADLKRSLSAQKAQSYSNSLGNALGR
ncbi:anthranilate phosphoribosyltransferase-like [Pyrus ussuriensis x Pyrus communis]|uniref:Anthranilate phosphoribosyltransferase-like n=1 Tax=Pyrus ussuriensis x Pyrus communis TaxID=2448454 RepID=A0A5N5GVC6_9ROSA|nr:anthranilate phosphoribosyltransferase-like [Pyrus ussuriensis x Pyrus communis]